MTRCAFSVLFVVLTSSMCSGADVATRADLREIFGHEKFTLLYHVRDISEHDWAAAAVHPCREVSRSQHLRDSLVDPGHAWAVYDYMDGPCQLLLLAKNPKYEILSYWEASGGSHQLRVMVLRRGPKPKLIFHAIMYNDIDHARWTWGEIRGHVLQGRFDPIIPSDVGT